VISAVDQHQVHVAPGAGQGRVQRDALSWGHELVGRSVDKEKRRRGELRLDLRLDVTWIYV
jgi:hypothetical protein